MTKEEALIEFFKGFRIAFNNAAAYSKDHPYYIKSAQDFKLKVESLFTFLDPVKIGIEPISVSCAGKAWSNLPLYFDLAQMFHLRKIKTIEFQRGISTEEMVDFISTISMPIKMILRSGGVQNILDPSKMPHCKIEELDYSTLLRDEKEGSKDSWAYLLSVTVKKNEPERLLELADKFGKIISDFKASDLIEDEVLRNKIYEFLNLLKAVDRDKFNTCTKALFKLFLRENTIPEGDRLAKAKAFFNGLSEMEFVETLCDEITANEQFSPVNLSVFTRLIDPSLHKGIAYAFREVLNRRESLKNNSAVRKKIKELFLTPGNSFVPSFYNQALIGLFDTKGPQGREFFLDKAQLAKKYRFILLDLFVENNKNKGSLASAEYLSGLILERILKETDAAIKENNWDYLKLVLDISSLDLKEDKSSRLLLDKLNEHIYRFIEDSAFKDNVGIEIEPFIDCARQNYLELSAYLDKIFKEEKVNKYVLTLFLRFFPNQLDYFYTLLEQKRLNIDFLYSLIQVLKVIKDRQANEILKAIFAVSNNIIRLEVLETMQLLPYSDEGFLLSVLREDEVILKKEALSILCKNADSCDKALKELFYIKGRFGSKNDLLIDNIRLIDRLRLSPARQYLLALSKRHFFWNRSLRETAREALKNL